MASSAIWQFARQVASCLANCQPHRPECPVGNANLVGTDGVVTVARFNKGIGEQRHRVVAPGKALQEYRTELFGGVEGAADDFMGVRILHRLEVGTTDPFSRGQVAGSHQPSRPLSRAETVRVEDGGSHSIRDRFQDQAKAPGEPCDQPAQPPDQHRGTQRSRSSTSNRPESTVCDDDQKNDDRTQQDDIVDDLRPQVRVGENVVVMDYLRGLSREGRDARLVRHLITGSVPLRGEVRLRCKTAHGLEQTDSSGREVNHQGDCRLRLVTECEGDDETRQCQSPSGQQAIANPGTDHAWHDRTLSAPPLQTELGIAGMGEKSQGGC